MLHAGGKDAREARLRAGGVAQAAEAVRDQGTNRCSAVLIPCSAVDRCMCLPLLAFGAAAEWMLRPAGSGGG
jgi:hypothetical protein